MVTWYTESGSSYNPTVTANSVLFSPNVNNIHAAVLSNETFTGNVVIEYDVALQFTGYQVRFRITPGQYIANDCGYFSPSGAKNTLYVFQASYLNVIQQNFHVKEEYNTVAGTLKWTTSGAGFTTVVLDRTFGPQAIRLRFSSGDGSASADSYQHSQVSITNIVVTSNPVGLSRSFGMIL